MSSPNKCLLCWLYKQELCYRDKRQLTGTVAGVQCQAKNFINPELPQKMADFWVWLSFLLLSHLKANFPFPPLITSWSSWTKFWDKDEIHNGPTKRSKCIQIVFPQKESRELVSLWSWRVQEYFLICVCPHLNREEVDRWRELTPMTAAVNQIFCLIFQIPRWVCFHCETLKSFRLRCNQLISVGSLVPFPSHCTAAATCFWCRQEGRTGKNRDKKRDLCWDTREGKGREEICSLRGPCKTKGYYVMTQET